MEAIAERTLSQIKDMTKPPPAAIPAVSEQENFSNVIARAKADNNAIKRKIAAAVKLDDSLKKLLQAFEDSCQFLGYLAVRAEDFVWEYQE